MSTLFSELRERQVKLWREGDQLRFTAPAGALTPELRMAMTERKHELLAVLAAEPAAEGAPLSFAQERLWVVDQLDPGLAHYNVALCWRLTGPLDVSALARAGEEMERRHEILRTVFRAAKDGRPVQIVQPMVPRDLAAHTATAGELEALASAEAERPFDLAAGPLWRRSLIRFGAEDHALLITWHHIIYDAWSLSVFAREFAELYRAFRDGAGPDLPAPAMQYADFSVQQRAAAESPAMRAHLDYWRKQLAGERPPIALPFDRARPLKPSHRGASRDRELPAKLCTQVRNLARQEGVPPFVFFLAVFKALLARYTGEYDLTVGSPIAQRSRVECEGLIGFFLNMLALRTDVSGDPTFRALLGRVRGTVFDAYRHQDAPFEKIVEELQPSRDASHHPLFQVGFVLQPTDGASLSLQGLKVTQIDAPATTAKFDLTLFLRESGSGMRASMEFNTEVFAPETVDRMLASFEWLLAAIVADVRTPLSRLAILSAAEEKQLLVTWNGASREYPHDRTVQAIFEEVAAREPEGVAIIDGAVRISYRELNGRANAIAAELRERGIASGSLVGLPAERSARFIAGVLGILKAGGAYVPLDTAEAPERLGRMISQCETTLDFAALPLVPVTENPGAQASAGAAACMLFTSGSTGAPKGVVVPHRAINRLVCNNDYAPFLPNDVVAFAANPCFDAATFEIWGALLHGGMLVTVSPDVLLSPRALEAQLTLQKVTILFLTTSLFNRLAHEAPAMFAGLRHLVFGGEAADPASVRLVLEHGKPQRLVNGYGPTETTTFAICHQIEAVTGAAVPIGRPIANTQVYLLDAAQVPVPIGVTGEIYIGGPGVALGYYDAPELTAERFVETRFGRLYRTRDLARWLPDGTIDYLGRADGQIKLRGFRIEPSEIEAALRKANGVADCRVVHESGRIAAYYIPAGDSVPTAEQLRESLAPSLPSPMIPSAFVPVPAFPLTRNGKLDRAALPIPEVIRSGAGAPRTPVEEEVAALWEEVLGRTKVAVDDDFFHLGGHSLLAIRLLGRVREKFEVDLPVRSLFEAPTVAGVARFIETRREAAAPISPLRSLIAIQRGDPARRPFFLVPGGWGGEIEFLVYGTFARHLGADIPIYGFRARGFDGSMPPHRSVAEMAADYVAEIRSHQRRGPYLIGGECVGGVAAYEIARILAAQGEQIALLALLDTHCPSKEGLEEFCLAERAEARARFWEVRVRQPLRGHLKKLSQLSFGGKLRYICQRILRIGPGAAAPVRIEERKHLEHYPRMLKGHTLRPYPGRVTLLLPRDAHESMVEAAWQSAPTGGIDIHMLPGDHLSYIREHAGTAAAKLRELIEQAHRTIPC